MSGAQGRPEFSARTLGSFEAYVRVVGGILQASALDEGFLTVTTAEPSRFIVPPKDADADLKRLIEAWLISYIGYNLTDAKTLLNDVAPKDFLLDAKDRLIALGMFVKKNAGRTIAGHRIVCEKVKDSAGRERNRFRLVDAKQEA